MANSLTDDIYNSDFAAALGHLDRFLHTAPFTVTALATAIEMIDDPAALHSTQERRVPLVALAAPHDKSAFGKQINALLAQGYTVVKLKVGLDVARDLEHVRDLQRVLANRYMVWKMSSARRNSARRT